MILQALNFSCFLSMLSIQTWSFVFLLTILLLISLRHRNKYTQKEKALKQQVVELERKVVENQINPHFIFNSLNAIKGYIIESKIEEGTNYVSRFAQVIRLMLNHSKEQWISLTKEIETIQIYVWLEQERLNHKFDAKFDLSFESDPASLRIPPLLLQPFVENAIWHGLMSLETKGQLLIKMTEGKDGLRIEIQDNGIGRQEALAKKEDSVFKKPALGLKLAQDRLKQINIVYDLQAEIKIEDLFPKRRFSGTKVTITFPKLRIKTRKNA